MTDENAKTDAPEAADKVAVVGEQTTYEKATAGLEKWLVKHVHNSNVSQDTDRFNRVRTLVAQLKKEIETL